MNNPEPHCPRCGVALSPDAVGGLCPGCLIEAALAEPESPEGEPPDVDAAALAAAGFAPAADAAVTDRFGDYRLEGELGRGGMGIIYRAHQVSLNRPVALKMILAGPLSSADFARRLRIEAEAAARLDHPHIVPIYEVGEHEGQPFYTMRLVEGTNLATAVKAGPFEPRAAAALLVTVAQAVQHAHDRGVLHRDLKPSNILLDARGEPHVSDFGLAKFVHGDSSLTLSQAALGTPSYMAPEQAAGGSKTVTTAADVYSLGAILYELLTGRALFQAETPLEAIRNVMEREPERPSRVNPHVPPDLETICLKCLQKEPGRRYASAAALAEDLERWLASKPIRARRVGLAERGWLWCRRKPALAGLAGALVLTLIGASVVAAWRIAVARGHQRREAYYAAVALADKFIQDGSPDRAMDLLLRCPEELRHWEWGYLVGQCHQEVLTIPAHPVRPGFFVFSVKSLAFDASGERLITLGVDGQLKAWDANTGGELFALGDTNSPVAHWTLHPTRPELLFSRGRGEVRRLDLRERRELPVPARAPDADTVSSLAYAPDGTAAATATDSGRITLWDTASGEVRWTVSVGPALGEQLTLREAVTATGYLRNLTGYPRVSFSTDGRRLIAQERVSAWWLDRDTGSLLASRELDPLRYWGLWVSPDGGSQVAIGTRGEVELLHGTGAGRRVGRIIASSPELQRSVIFSPDGRYFGTGGESGTARVFALPGGEELVALPGRVQTIVFSPEGERLALLGGERRVPVWDMERGDRALTLRGHLQTVSGAAFTVDGRRIATADRAGDVKVWSALPGRSAWLIEGWPKAVNASPDGRWIAGAAAYGDLQLWDAESGARVRSLRARWSQPFYSDFSPDSRWVATTAFDPIGRLWEVATGNLVGLLRGGTNTLWWVRFSPDGRSVAALDTAGTLWIWDVPSRSVRRSIPTGIKKPLVFAFNRASDQVVVTAMDVPPVLIELKSGRRETLPVEVGPAWWASFSPDDRLMALSGFDGVLRILDATNRRLIGAHQSRGPGTATLDFSPDGRRMAVAASDTSMSGFDPGLLQIWDTEQWRELIAFGGRADFFDITRFATDGSRRLVADNYEGTMCQWEAFPWRDHDYAGQPGATLAARIRAYATGYWRERLVKEAEGVARAAADTNATAVMDDLDLPARDPRCGPGQIDLSPFCNARLDAWLYPTVEDLGASFSLAALPTGLVTLLDVAFDIRGVIVTRAFERRGDRTERLWHRQPARVEGIPVRQRVRRLHVLQAACPADAVADGTAIGSYVWHYTDGTTHEEPIVYGRDLRHWMIPGEERTQDLERGRIAWVGDTPQARQMGARVRLYLTTYVNPRPEREVSHLDFTSRVIQAAPFLVALTVEP